MTQEEKAKAYDEALTKAKIHINCKGIGDTVNLCTYLFPELTESEDERIKSIIIDCLNRAVDVKYISLEDRGKCLAYLEKQGEQKVSVDDFKAKDWYVSKVDGKIHNIYYSVDKVKPKFKVGDKIIEKDFDKCGRGTIIDIKDGKYIFDDGGFICIEEQGLWKLVEQKPAWSEEDERIRKELIEALKASKTVGELKFVLPEPIREECIAYLEKQKECVADSSKTSVDEDESIRKFLVDYFTSYKIGNVATKLNGVRIDDILNYLEKQKETLHILEMCKENANSFTDGVIEVRSFQRGLEEGKRLERQKENSKSADSISSDCESNAKCENRWHKVEDSLPDSTREVLCKDAIGNYFIGRYYSKGVWEVSMYDDCDKSNEDNPPVVKWCEIPSEKQKEQKHPNGCFTCDEYKKGYEEGRRNGFTAGYNKAMKEVEQKEQKPVVTLGETYHVDTLGTQQVIAGKMPQKPAEWSEKHIADIFEKVGLAKIVREQGNDELTNALQDAMLELSKVGNTEWSEEDEKMRNLAIEWAETMSGQFNFVDMDSKDFHKIIAWLKSLPERFNPQPKQKQNDYITPHKEFFKFIYDRLINVHKENPNVDYMRSFKERLNNLSFGEKQEWSEEDEKMLQSIIKDFRAGKVSTIGQEQWLKSLRPQSKQEWSKEDERKLQHCIDIVGVWEGDYDIAYAPYSNFLKSLRPSWKPSEEQMDSLRDTIINTKGYSYSMYLPELYEQLKKL